LCAVSINNNQNRRAKPGDRAAVNLPDAHAISYVCIDKNNLAALVIADDQYPEKVAFMVI